MSMYESQAKQIINQIIKQYQHRQHSETKATKARRLIKTLLYNIDGKDNNLRHFRNLPLHQFTYQTMTLPSCNIQTTANAQNTIK
ncbi:CLUMA_CG018283, isoform A [Clunio marinus]|uniref:CLUMA_CG018283, isoform A n=1 Tax=Clunio marinus TaxID=568069 RepID=A0A1J1IYZ1_9DIPT|nr:CLUMA_CG018283, isoform A [Clunio marinus]